MAPSPLTLPPDSTTSRVVEAVAVNSRADPMEMPPLYDVLDPDALDALVASMSDGTVSFTYAGTEVTIDSRSGIEVSAHPPSTG